MSNIKGGFASFSVSDLAKAKDFYSSKLGLDVAEDNGVLQIKFGSAHAMAYAKPDHVPASYTVLNFAVDDINKAVDDLIGKGVKFEQYPDLKTNDKGISSNGGVSLAWFKDPAGNIMSVIEDKR